MAHTRTTHVEDRTQPTTLVEAYDTLTQVEKEAILSKILDVCIEEYARKNKTLMYRLMEEYGLSNLDTCPTT